MWEKYVEKSFYLGAKQMIGRNKDRHLKYKETDRMDQSGLVVTFSNLLKSFKIGRMLEIIFFLLWCRTVTRRFLVKCGQMSTEKLPKVGFPIIEWI